MKENDSDQDVMGEILWERYQGKDVYGIVERDDEFIWISDGVLYYFADYPEWTSINKEAMLHVHGKILDIGCGVGRVSLYLQERGYDVVGIDQSPLAIKVCRCRGLKNTRVLSVEDIHELQPSCFDTVLLLGNCFGILQNQDGVKTFLERISGMTSKDAKILAETHSPYENEEPVHLRYRQRNLNLNRMPGQERIRLRFKHLKSKWFDDLGVSKQEMKDLLNDSSWRISEFIEREISDYYVAVIKKLNCFYV